MIEGVDKKLSSSTKAYGKRARVVEGFLELLEELSFKYLSYQLEAGAEALMLFDSWLGSFQKTSKDFLQPVTKRPISRLKVFKNQLFTIQ